MAQLVDPVEADSGHAQVLFDPLKVARAHGHGAHAAGGHGHLGGGGEHVDHVLFAVLFQLVVDIQQMVPVFFLGVEIMHGVGVVPEDTEILSRGIQGGEPAHHFVGEGDAAGIGVLGDHPDALDRRIGCDQLFNRVHVRAVRQHGHRHVFYVEIIGNGKMPVIARAGAEELDLIQLMPGGHAIQHAADPGVAYGEMHHVQRGGAAHQHL